MKKRRKLTWHERFLVLKEASRLYAASWVRDIGPDLRPNDYKKDDGTEDKSNGDKGRSTEIEPSTLEDIASYRDALKEFHRRISRRYPADHGEKGIFF
ncbi:uncharacterized protein LOC108476764 isoform X2 [Gossypium arboreum]|uniref:uncharacterized protein LOC108476764 isoform X2 n=1 Tax=Gossypium arboreum TaxID=29729 RepID=UPI0022F174E2|nr:uncharacterized protein LOC108476764 isoform X2 [Gossypium arboreum]